MDHLTRSRPRTQGQRWERRPDPGDDNFVGPDLSDHEYASIMRAGSGVLCDHCGLTEATHATCSQAVCERCLPLVQAHPRLHRNDDGQQEG